MFGYIGINRQELKVRELERYRAFYCGLCDTLRTRYGLGGQMTLTYDMTFLIILLSSLYELEEKRDLQDVWCILQKNMYRSRQPQRDTLRI